MTTSNKKEQLKQKAQWYISEYLKCKNDFIYFCKNYVYLELGGGDTLFNPYDEQIELVNTINKKNNIICLKSRQIGISTTMQAYCSWLSIFYKNVVIGIVSKDAPEATDFARSIRGMLDKLPPWFGVKWKKNTERSFILSNGSKLYATPVPPNAPEKTLRGKNVTFLIIDEAAFVKYIDDAWTSMVPALSTNQKNARKVQIPYGTVILSTPNKTVGTGKWFYSKWCSAKNDDSIFTPFQIHWKDVKELKDDPTWYETQCKMFDNDPKKIQQELELKFISTDGSFFDETTIEKLQDKEKQTEPIETLKLVGGYAWKFQEPIPGKHYLIGVDTATEYGSDKSAIEIFDFETLEQVWEFQGKCKVTEFCNIVKSAASVYHNSTIVIEDNSIGNQVKETLNASEHSAKVYKRKQGNNRIAGLSTNSATRPLMIDALYTFITSTPEIIKSERLSLELIGLTEKKGKVEADTGMNDDLALASAMAMYVRKYDPPLMVNINKYQENSFMDIMSLNREKSVFDDSFIKRESNEMINEGKSGLINTFDFFDFDGRG